MPNFLNGRRPFAPNHVLKKITRVKFNPSNKQHLQSYWEFIHNGRWGDVLFEAELPHIEVPATVADKFIKYALAKEFAGIQPVFLPQPKRIISNDFLPDHPAEKRSLNLVR